MVANILTVDILAYGLVKTEDKRTSTMSLPLYYRGVSPISELLQLES